MWEMLVFMKIFVNSKGYSMSYDWESYCAFMLLHWEWGGDSQSTPLPLTRGHSFGRFEKQALLTARTKRPYFSYPRLACAFKSLGLAYLSSLEGVRETAHCIGYQRLNRWKCGRFIHSLSASEASHKFLKF
jgi:hypothetical protein